MRSLFLMLCALSALTAVAMGAFGAHGLKQSLTPEMMSVYKTAVDYQMWHALGLGMIALVSDQNRSSKLLKWSGWLLFVGIVLFSGSLYFLALSNIKWLGMITPLGGMAFLGGWLLLLVFAARNVD